MFRIKDGQKKTSELQKRYGMPRPPKIDEPTKTYNLLMTKAQYDKLATHAESMQKRSLEQVAVADLIRDAIDIYLESLEDDDYEGGVGSSSGDGV